MTRSPSALNLAFRRQQNTAREYTLYCDKFDNAAPEYTPDRDKFDNFA